MADDRPVGDVVDELGALKKLVEDMRTTLMARTSRRPTGDVEWTLRTTAKPDTLLLDGSAVSRTTYPVLWQWVQDQGLIVSGGFTVGDGSTTFGLPDMRGRVQRGKPAAEAIGQLTGSDSLTLSTGQLPSHTHTFTTGSSGSHGGHVAQNLNAASGGIFTITADNSNNNDGSHTHSGTTAGTGSGTPIDIRQAGINGNYLIYI